MLQSFVSFAPREPWPRPSFATRHTHTSHSDTKSEGQPKDREKKTSHQTLACSVMPAKTEGYSLLDFVVQHTIAVRSWWNPWLSMFLMVGSEGSGAEEAGMGEGRWEALARS